MAYSMEEIDPVGTNPESTDARPESRSGRWQVG